MESSGHTNAAALFLSQAAHNESSVESPFTSLGSGCTSYNSMMLAAGLKSHAPTSSARSRLQSSLTDSNYGSLKMKAEEGHAKYESRTKAVMDALQGLQSKIRKIETDRTNAEMNLKCLAIETKDYKKLLKKKQSLGENNGVTTESQSKELENQLEHAQGRCLILEKQLESMRKMMKIKPLSKTTSATAETSRVTRSASSCRQKKNSSTQKSFNDTLPVDTSAIEKLIDLEKENERLTATQCQTEEKINKLEEKIRRESHHRKLLQDKTKELQNVFGAKKKLDGPFTPSPQLVKKKRRKKVSISAPSNETKLSSSQGTEKSSTSATSHSPPHYLVDFSNIPFVVGQSTSKSHSLGANIQSVLSIMKSHNMLCCEGSPKSCATSHSKCKPKQSALLGSCEHLQELLTALQDEFAQLGFEHREIVSRLKTSTNSDNSNQLEKKREAITQRMEGKGKQIRIIEEHLEKVRTAEKEKEGRNRRCRKESKVTIKNPSDTVEIVTTVRRSPEVKENPNLDMYKKVRKLQSALCKDDLKWV